MSDKILILLQPLSIFSFTPAFMLQHHSVSSILCLHKHNKPLLNNPVSETFLGQFIGLYWVNLLGELMLGAVFCFLLLLLSFLLTQRTKMIITLHKSLLYFPFSPSKSSSLFSLPPDFRLAPDFYMRSSHRSKRNRTEKQLKKKTN